MPAYAVLMPDGTHAPLTVNPREWKALVGDKRTENSIRRACMRGDLPTLPRRKGSAEPHQIPVAKAMEMLGVPCEVVTVADDVRAAS